MHRRGGRGDDRVVTKKIRQRTLLVGPDVTGAHNEITVTKNRASQGTARLA
jgi:hypothetical protein